MNIFFINVADRGHSGDGYAYRYGGPETNPDDLDFGSGPECGQSASDRNTGIDLQSIYNSRLQLNLPVWSSDLNFNFNVIASINALITIRSILKRI